MQEGRAVHEIPSELGEEADPHTQSPDCVQIPPSAQSELEEQTGGGIQELSITSESMRRFLPLQLGPVREKVWEEWGIGVPPVI